MTQNEQIKSMIHKYGLRLIKNTPNVISATHVERKKHVLDNDGKLIPIPEHLIRISLLKDGGKIQREVILKGHPNNIGIEEYKFIVNSLQNGK